MAEKKTSPVKTALPKKENKSVAKKVAKPAAAKAAPKATKAVKAAPKHDSESPNLEKPVSTKAAAPKKVAAKVETASIGKKAAAPKAAPVKAAPKKANGSNKPVASKKAPEEGKISPAVQKNVGKELKKDSIKTVKKVATPKKETTINSESPITEVAATSGDKVAVTEATTTPFVKPASSDPGDSRTAEKKPLNATADHFPEHGPIDPKTGKEIILSLKNIDITFGKGDKAVKAVKNASFDIYKSETFSLVGESGSGKTTIGRAVIRVNPLAGGEIDYKGVRISGRIPHSLDREVIRNIQMVFQDPAASLNERATVDYIISEGLYNFHLFKDEKDRVQKVENIIKEVGLLPEHLTRYPHEFSGGQRQRIGIARAMVMEPQFIVADEPISALDVSVRSLVLNLMRRFQKEKGLTYLFIAHDLSVVRFISDRIGVIYKGNIVEVAEAEELFNYPLHPYTKSLISAIPVPDPTLEKHKKLFIYDPKVHDYSVDKPEFVDVGHNHFVYGNKKEIEEYKALRAKNTPIKAVAIGENKESDFVTDQTVSGESILDRPIHDTGATIYGVLSFFLPIAGIIAAFIYKKIKYYRNYKICLKWSLIMFGIILAIIIFFLILIGCSVIHW